MGAQDLIITLIFALHAARKQIAYDLEGASGAAEIYGGDPAYAEPARLLDANREASEGVLMLIDDALRKAGEFP